jgi:hypothetical protein
MSGRYILKGHRPVRCRDLFEWALWMHEADRCVALSIQGDVRVSTVFLGLDHNHWEEGPPILFESTAFVGHESVGCDRYSTWKQAEDGHRNMVAHVFKATPILAIPKETIH